MKKVAFFHTTMNTPLALKKAFEERYPGVPLITVMDDGIVPEVIAHDNQVTPGIVRKLISFAQENEKIGAVVVVCMCTTITEAVEEAAKAVDIPFLTIDGPMLDAAVCAGQKVALLVTAQTTVRASGAAIRRACTRNGRENVQTDTILVKGAFEALNVEKDKARHDALIAQAAREAAKDHDVIVLAQVSMVDAAQALADLQQPVFTSLDSGLAQIGKYLEN